MMFELFFHKPIKDSNGFDANSVKETLERIDREIDYICRAIKETQTANTRNADNLESFIEESDKREIYLDSCIHSFQQRLTKLENILAPTAIMAAPVKVKRNTRAKPRHGARRER